MEKLRVAVGEKERFKEIFVRRMLKWVDCVERMGDEKLATRSDGQKVEGKLREEEGECDGGLR